MKVGFTGTREGMTDAQFATLCDLLDKWDVEAFAQGDCIGADAQANYAAVTMGQHPVIHVFPPDNPKLRAWTSMDDMFTVVHEEKSYAARNQDIVDFADVLVAAPKSYQEQQHSGTWQTIRMAWKANKVVFVLGPKGGYMRRTH